MRTNSFSMISLLLALAACDSNTVTEICAQEEDASVPMDLGEAQDASEPLRDADTPRDASVVIADASVSADATVDASVSPAMRMFATAARYDGNLGGLSGADMKCQLAADAQSLGGTWRAWLSTPSTNAIDHITGAGPWATLDGDVVFRNRAALQTVPASAIGSLTTESGGEARQWWTGTDVGGTTATATCSGWTTDITSAGGYYGTSFGSSAWTNYGYVDCSTELSVLCFEIE